MELHFDGIEVVERVCDTERTASTAPIHILHRGLSAEVPSPCYPVSL